MKNDIENRDDIVLLVNTFYQRVREDELIGPVFEQRIQGNWEPHLATMHDFWYTLLFGKEAYRGNPFAKHIGLPVDSAHFERWLSLFHATLDELFDGARKDMAKKKADSIAQVFQSKLAFLSGSKR
ncbi:MAG: group III truncated hemoglobin [Chitinophagaceae bacterium]|nr:MAG: group III truncated hemoglobin [Chitinophagaceae bacterium]